MIRIEARDIQCRLQKFLNFVFIIFGDLFTAYSSACLFRNLFQLIHQAISIYGDSPGTRFLELCKCLRIFLNVLKCQIL